MPRGTRQTGRMTTPVLQIIIGSTRPGRVGLPVARWFEGVARADGRFEVEVIDLAEVNLPMLDEPNHPAARQYTQEHTKAWSATIERGDAFVFVIPEYNYSVNGATKNALDYLFHEWARKPLGVVSYGGVSAGLRAAQVLKQSAAALRMLVTNDVVMIPMVRSLIDDEGTFVPTPLIEESATLLLDEVETLLAGSKSMR